MLVPVRTLLAGTAEPCWRKAWALTGGLGKVFAGRSNSGAEFILFLSTLLASTFRRQREQTEYIRWATWSVPHQFHYWRSHMLLSPTVVPWLHTPLGRGEILIIWRWIPSKISTPWDWLCSEGDKTHISLLIPSQPQTTLTSELQILIGSTMIKRRASKMTRSLPVSISAPEAECI